MAITPFKVIQGADFGAIRKLECDFLLVNTLMHVILAYIIFCTVSKLLRIIRQIFAFNWEFRSLAHSFGMSP